MLEIQHNPKDTLVMKFGGTSVGDANAILNAAAITARYAADWPRLVVVVSAMAGITENLLRCAQFAAQRDELEYKKQLSIIEIKNLETVNKLIPDSPHRNSLRHHIERLMWELRHHCEEISREGFATPRVLDTIASLGERMNAHLFSTQLRNLGKVSKPVNAAELIITDNHFQNAEPLERQTKTQSNQVLQPLLQTGVIPVVTGFIGSTKEGDITTLGRGGSDYTATILGASLKASEVWIWTDVAGVMTADPRLVPEASIVSRIGYADVHELANFGGRVLHPKTILPVRKHKIPVRVRHSFDPDFPGTYICKDSVSSEKNDLIVTMLSGCRWGKRNGKSGVLLIREGEKFSLPVDFNTARISDTQPVSVVSLVGQQACSESLTQVIIKSLKRRNVEILGTNKPEARNRFSLVVPASNGHQALLTLHNEVIYS